jgi:hypothetical protein
MIANYKPLLIALFEYYLYENYPPEAITQLQESCLPFSAMESFYAEFASGESSRLSKLTFYEMFKRIVGLDPENLASKPSD